ncbi:hypothetical protein HH_0666 [Helicobacter hepaticus ATCC 51449]|uniref:Uncharacterized protein n=1 Tax=Helicobacter hepaticus (strain ATCC 51449 / 3B1) TaxID=235279 RepID=Q7VIE0_HELHP|nr:hypothetical protein HH_0666 [Helicobacter hepaticus ATCC 51449]
MGFYHKYNIYKQLLSEFYTFFSYHYLQNATITL